MSRDRPAADLTHQIIEAAKESYRADQDMPFVQHLEMQARALCPDGSGWIWETKHTGSGGWGIELTEWKPRDDAGAQRTLL